MTFVRLLESKIFAHLLNASIVVVLWSLSAASAIAETVWTLQSGSAFFDDSAGSLQRLTGTITTELVEISGNWRFKITDISISGDTIAFVEASTGGGSIDLVKPAGPISPVHVMIGNPDYARFMSSSSTTASFTGPPNAPTSITVTNLDLYENVGHDLDRKDRLSLVLAPKTSATWPIEWVPIEHASNPPDDAANCNASKKCGSVPYSYSISKFEITNAQYVDFLNAVDPQGANALGLYNVEMKNDDRAGGIELVTTRSRGARYAVKTVPSSYGNRPVAHVSFFDALRFSNWLNNGQGSSSTERGAYTLIGNQAIPTNGSTVTRNAGARVFLTSENEWYKAAYYDSAGQIYYDYPTETDVITTCASPGDLENSANCDRKANATTPVGAYYFSSTSPSKTSDQGGNLSEWNEEIINGRRGVRGGAWIHPATHLASSFVGGQPPASETHETGFRLAMRKGDECEHAMSADEKLQAVLAASYCVGAVAPSGLQTMAVQRCYSGENTCEAACREYGQDIYRKPATFLNKGADLGCRKSDALPFVFGGRSKGYFNSDVPRCDWCCCQIK